MIELTKYEKFECISEVIEDTFYRELTDEEAIEIALEWFA